MHAICHLFNQLAPSPPLTSGSGGRFWPCSYAPLFYAMGLGGGWWPLACTKFMGKPSMTTLTTATQIKRSETILYSELLDEVAMMDIEKWKYYGVDDAGARIWLLLEQPMSIEAICQQLIREYKISLEACRKEVLHFVAELQEHGIIEVVV